MIFYTRIENRLREWARWWLTVESGNDGYPKRSMIQIFRDGAALNQEFGSIPLVSSLRAQETDILLKRMEQYNPHYSNAIAAYYLLKKPPREMAADLCVSKRTFYRRIEGAKDWLDTELKKFGYHQD